MPLTKENISGKIVDIKGDIISMEFEKTNIYSTPVFEKEKSTTAISENQIIFYKPIYKKDGVEDVVILYVPFIEFLNSRGYRRFDVDKQSLFIQVKDKVIKEVTTQQILDDLIDYIDQMPNEIPCEAGKKIKKSILKEKFFKSPQTYNSDQKLAQLKREPIVFNIDNKTETFIYYKNGFVVCNKEGWKLKQYNELPGYIWESQILPRDFFKLNIEEKDLKDVGEFSQFVYNISKGLKRFESCCSIIGSVLCSHTDRKMKAPIFTDSSLSESANGRSGKTLMGESFQYIKKTTIIPGKDFNPDEPTKYQQADMDTQIVFLNDVKNKFDFEKMYNDITEGIKVKKLYLQPFILKVPIIISTNKTIKIEGGSSEDRCIEFEFSDYYYAGFGPDNEFGHRFFSDWNDIEWTKFDNFMLYCISLYLGNGIIKPENENLNRRKLVQETDPDFVYFMDKKTGLIKEDSAAKPLQEETKVISILFNEQISKHDLHFDFLTENFHLKDEKYKSKLSTFTKWVQAYVKYDLRFRGLEEKKSGSNRFYIFKSN